MKYFISILLMMAYLAGTFQTSWTLIDFYFQRDHYTQKYCELLDLGITQCRASCYLEKSLSENSNTKPTATIEPFQIKKLTEQANDPIDEHVCSTTSVIAYGQLTREPHSFEYHSAIFRPPIS